LGSTYNRSGEYPKAIEFLNKALDIALLIGDIHGEGSIYGNLGSTYGNLGEYPKAIEFLNKALDIALLIDDIYGEGSIYSKLGYVYQALRDYPKAIEFLNKTLAIALQIGNKEGEGNAYANLGNAYRNLGDYSKALELHSKALDITIQIGNKEGEGNAYANLGNAYRSLEEYPKAIEFYSKALDIALQVGNRQGEGNAYGSLGSIYRNLGDYSKAIEYQKQYLDIALQVGDKQGEGNAYGNLGLAYDSLGDFLKAIEYHKQQLTIALQIGDKQGEGNAYGNLGNGYRSLGDYPKAISNAVKASLIFMQIQSPNLRTTFKILRAIRTKLPLTEFEALLDQTHPSQQYRSLLEQAGVFAPIELHTDFKRLVYFFVLAIQGNLQTLQEVQQWIATEKDNQDWANLTVVVAKLLAGERSKEVLFSPTPTANQNQPASRLNEIEIAIIEMVLAILAQPSLLIELEQEVTERATNKNTTQPQSLKGEQFMQLSEEEQLAFIAATMPGFSQKSLAEQHAILQQIVAQIQSQLSGQQAATTRASVSGLDPQLEEIAKLIGAAIGGDAQARQVVEQQVLPQMEAADSGFRNLAALVRLLLAGKRNLVQLLDPKHNLDEIDQKILIIALRVAQAYAEQAMPESEEAEEENQQSFINMIVAVIVAAAGGDEEAANALDKSIERMVDKADTHKLGMALTKLVAGERDAAKLTKGLDQQGQAIIAKILANLTA
jgi:tetratricopeptide (TPR) repeat protein